MKTYRVGIAGFGAIGKALAQALDRGIDGMRLTAIAVRDPSRPPDLAALAQPPLITDIAGLEPHCDIAIECAPAKLLPAIAEPMLHAGKKVVVLSSGALLQHPELFDLAARHGGQILIPSGAILGLDALVAAAQGTIHSVKMVTRKPVRGLLGAPYFETHHIDLAKITEPTLIFRGTPREAAIGFPANLNVSVSLGLAGIGPDKTQLEIWADPALDRNKHRVEVESDSASFSMEIQNIPSENPKTGRITALSVIALLRKFAAPVSVGT
ncbi:aspartate dehydrogenase [Candidimonas humi]|uniref:L-aspartate dehydrogenase n=1 Tax=Candidimonas humi TaxID=683355 RepID=A0ABV8NX45_9BURK|nr:aspartate dehydrogenase [Candidimonas humi]MBV6303975.1 aspartate dehydrogenase [Candidimonas humi]